MSYRQTTTHIPSISLFTIQILCQTILVFTHPFICLLPILHIHSTKRQTPLLNKQGNSWVERIPVEQRYTEYVPEQRIEYKPVERRYTDYVEIEHYRDYVPVPRLERRVEYVPIERYDEAVDYVPVERSSVVRQPLSNSLAYSRYSRYPSRYYY